MTIHQSDPGDEHRTPVRAAIVIPEKFRKAFARKPVIGPRPNPQVIKSGQETD